MFVPTDWVVLVLSSVGLGAVVAGAEWARRVGCRAASTRRGVHATVCLFVAVTPWLFSGPAAVSLLAGAFVLVNGIAWALGWWPGVHEARPDSWGTVGVPLAVVLLAPATWGVAIDRVVVFQAAFLVLGVADPLAAAVGERYGHRRWTGTATLAGSAACVLGASGLVTGVLVLEGWYLVNALSAAGAVGAIAAGAEAVGQKGSDNLLLSSAVVLTLLPLFAHGGTAGDLWMGVLAGAILSGGAVWARVLTPRAATTAGLLAISLVALGGLVWATPGLLFFVGASALSFLPGDSAGTGALPRRTAAQVWANGGVAWVLLAGWIVVPSGMSALRSLCYAGFVGALAAAAADTWATEVGERYAGPPYSLRTWDRVAPGASGAVSFLGTLAGVVGAATVTVGAWGLDALPGPHALIVLGAGTVGMLADGVAGATMEGQYRDGATGRLMDGPTSDAQLVRGWRVIDNNRVNLLGTCVGAVTAGVGIAIYAGA